MGLEVCSVLNFKLKIDITICVITGKDGRHAAEALRDLISRYPEVDGNIVHFKNHTNKRLDPFK
jgi:hypothetical protein